MWKVLWRNPRAVVLALLLHLVIAAPLFWRKTHYRIAMAPGFTGSVLKAQVMNTGLVKHNMQRFKDLQAKADSNSAPQPLIINKTPSKTTEVTQQQERLEAKRQAELQRQLVEDEKRLESKRQAELQRQLIEEEERLESKRQAELQRQLIEEEERLTHKILKQQAESEARQQAELKQQKIAEEMQRIATIESQKLAIEMAAKGVAEAKRQITMEQPKLTAEERLNRSIEMERQRLMAKKAAKRKSTMEQTNVATKISSKRKTKRQRLATKSTKRKTRMERPQIAMESQGQQKTKSQRQLMTAIPFEQELGESGQLITQGTYPGIVHRAAQLNGLNALQTALAAEQYERDQYALNSVQQQIYEKIRNNWRIPNLKKALHCTLKVHINTYGEVMDIQILESSGDMLFDGSAERAVQRAAPLPIIKEKHLFDEFLILVFDPKQ